MANFMNKFKSWIGLEEDDDEEYLYEDIESYQETQEEPEVIESKTTYQEPVSTYTSKEDTTDRRKRSNIVNLGRTSSDRVKINIHEPITFDDAPEVINTILRNEVAILNIEMLEPDLKKHIFDFVNGGIYALEASIQKVTTNIFVIAPKGIAIDGKIKDQIKSKGYYQL